MSEKKTCAATKKDGTPCTNPAITEVGGHPVCFVKAHQAQFEPDEETVCGHVNVHSTVFLTEKDYQAGKVSQLTCEKPQGHDGNHGGYYYLKRTALADDRVSINVLEEGIRWGEWTDMAGRPVEDIVPDEKTLKVQQTLKRLGLNDLSDLEKLIT
jgi:hypothetical protein